MIMIKELKKLLKHILNEIRNLFLIKIRYRYIKYGKNVHTHWSVKMRSKHKYIKLGNNVGIGRNSFLLCDIEIGNNVLIAAHSGLVGSDDHTYNIVGKTIWDSPRGDRKKIIIDDDVWIGFGSIILSGVKIGRGSIIGAGAVVTKNVESYSIVAGVPARLIKKRFTEEEILKHEAMVKMNNQ